MTYKTKYYGATNYKGARISVTDWIGRRSVHSYRFELGGMFDAGPRHLFAVTERAERDGITDPCAAFVQLPNEGGYIWSTRNEVTK